MKPAAAIARPQTMTAPITIRPSQRACSTQPVVSAATVAPAETLAYSRPVPLAPASKTVSASTANSARGMPNVIATRSIANEPISALLPRTNRRPSTIERRIGGCSVVGRRGLEPGERERDPHHHHERRPPAPAYAASTPNAAIISPPSAGPTTADIVCRP